MTTKTKETNRILGAIHEPSVSSPCRIIPARQSAPCASGTKSARLFWRRFSIPACRRFGNGRSVKSIRAGLRSSCSTYWIARDLKP